jgi:3-oxoacyl-[acyl-carrier-protein] synthase II
VNLLSVGAFDAMRALSLRNGDPSRASRPYDRNRDGFVFGEGAATLILEEYEHARARGAQIYAELAGYGFSSDAHHMTAPSVEGPARAMRMAMRDARLDPLDLDYVNAHATSTPLGDVNELRSLKMALGEEAARRVNISATKGMTGHLLGASAAVEAVFTTLAIRDSTIPPTINIEELDPECDLNVTPNEAVSRRVGVAMSNSFGFGGTNAALVFKAMS